MKLSALCLTYGRPYLLEESIESFLRQDYADKEMIIINDLEEQELIYEHPQVKIFNFKERFSSIGSKRNKAVELSSGDILVGWDDDDLYLPWFLSRFAKEFELDNKIELVQPNKSWCLSNGNLELTNGWSAYVAFSRKSFNAVGGYRDFNHGEDVDFLNRLRSYLNPDRHKVASFFKEDTCYIFRWGGTNSYHLSVLGKDSGLEKVKKFVESTPIVSKIELKPHWNSDYLKMVQDKLIVLKDVL
jgi:glycosyltransferase involved in cell wall biosynthesis